MVIPFTASKVNLPTLKLFAKKGFLEVPYPVPGVILPTLLIPAETLNLFPKKGLLEVPYPVPGVTLPTLLALAEK